MKGVKLPTPDDVTEEGGTLWAVRPPGGGVSEGGGGRAPLGPGTRMRGEGAEPGRGCALCSE